MAVKSSARNKQNPTTHTAPSVIAEPRSIRFLHPSAVTNNNKTQFGSRGRMFGRMVATITHLSPLIWIAMIGFIAGILWLLGLRFILVQPTDTHYHANFAIYIAGQHEEFKSFTYYQEIAACSSANGDNPQSRAHMHENVSDVVHVHDKRVTWADFFANLDWSIGKNFLETDQGMYQDTSDKQLMYILNGSEVARVDNKVIGDQDTLLISYGPPDSDFSKQYSTIQNHALSYDTGRDPASCSGINGSDVNSFKARLKRAVGFSG